MYGDRFMQKIVINNTIFSDGFLSDLIAHLLWLLVSPGESFYYTLSSTRKRRISGPVPQCTMLLCYSGSTSHNAQCFYDDHDQFSQFSPHCRIHVHSSIILKDTVWIAKFSWFSSLFGIFKALLSLDNLNR